MSKKVFITSLLRLKKGEQTVKGTILVRYASLNDELKAKGLNCLPNYRTPVYRDMGVSLLESLLDKLNCNRLSRFTLNPIFKGNKNLLSTNLLKLLQEK